MAHISPDSDEAITQINVVPLVDIMLVLLIIFMLTASFISTPSVPVKVPKALTSNPTAPASQALVLTVKGEIFYQNHKTNREELSVALREAAALNPNLRLVLSADAQVTHGKVVELLDLARQAGVTQIALGVTSP
jgi:biopolymer transport protein ExbD